MQFAVSYLGLGASGLYVLSAIAALAAAVTASACKQRSWHFRGWMLLVVLFLILAASRIFSVEEFLRELLREALRSDAAYSSRRDFQRPLVAAAIALAGLIGFWWFYRIVQSISQRRNIATMAALASGLGMVFLVAIRIISLHPIDRLLYGPLKLNWIADIGLSCAVLLAAITYIRIVRSAR